jgi:hypothetical protein
MLKADPPWRRRFLPPGNEADTFDLAINFTGVWLRAAHRAGELVFHTVLSDAQHAGGV